MKVKTSSCDLDMQGIKMLLKQKKRHHNGKMRNQPSGSCQQVGVYT